MKLFKIALAGVLATLLPAAGEAATLLYTIDGNGHHATFTLDSHPTEFVFNDLGYDFGISTTGSFDGVDGLAGITFYANPYPDGTPNPGGLTYLDNGTFTQIDWTGPQLYSGTEADPTLLAFGPTTFTDINTGAGMTISATEVGEVPEPATWATMVIGFALIGGACRSRRTAALAAA